MRLFLLITLIGFCQATPQFMYLNDMNDLEYNNLIATQNFKEFKGYFNKKYIDLNEELYRFGIFKYKIERRTNEKENFMWSWHNFVILQCWWGCRP